MLGAGVKVTRRDVGFGELRKLVKAMHGATIASGIQGREAQDRYTKSNGSPGATVVDVATYQEFGTATIPARSFMRRTAFEKRGEIKALIVINMRQLFRRPTMAKRAKALGDIGEGADKLIRAMIGTAKVWAKPLADSTVAAKGHDIPLHETGKLAESITYSIRDRSGRVIRRGR